MLIVEFNRCNSIKYAPYRYILYNTCTYIIYYNIIMGSTGFLLTLIIGSVTYVYVVTCLVTTWLVWSALPHVTRTNTNFELKNQSINQSINQSAVNTSAVYIPRTQVTDTVVWPGYQSSPHIYASKPCNFITQFVRYYQGPFDKSRLWAVSRVRKPKIRTRLRCIVLTRHTQAYKLHLFKLQRESKPRLGLGMSRLTSKLSLSLKLKLSLTLDLKTRPVPRPYHVWIMVRSTIPFH